MQVKELKALVRKLDKEWSAAVAAEGARNDKYPGNIKGHVRLAKKTAKAQKKYEEAKKKLNSRTRKNSKNKRA
jgi:hypothetical protein